MKQTDWTDKEALRKTAGAARNAISAEEHAAAAKTLAQAPFPVSFSPGTIISGYMPIGKELDPLPLMRQLEAQGAQLALPVVMRRGRPLVMRAWRFGAPLMTAGLGIQVPPPEAEVLDPDILLVPLLAFDRFGNRIGYGAGFYDMTLATLRAKKNIIAIGFGFAAQEAGRVPASPADERLNYILTEQGLRTCMPA